MYNPDLKSKEKDELFEALLALKSTDEAYAFFEDLCTVKEVEDMAQRFAVAKMLQKGKIYNVIERETGASSATISRVKKALEYGADGYKIILDKTNKT